MTVRYCEPLSGLVTLDHLVERAVAREWECDTATTDLTPRQQVIEETSYGLVPGRILYRS